MSPYATPIIVVQRKCKPGALVAETKSLLIDYWELNTQILKVQTTQAKLKGSLALIEMAKIDHIWSTLKGYNISPYLILDQNIIIFWYIQTQDQKIAFTCPYGKFQWKQVAFGVEAIPSIFLNFMFKLFLNV